jgi:hypothetical protein
MATVKFRIKNSTKQDKNTIYVYLSNGRGNMFEVKSGFSIDPNDWNTEKGFPKQSTPENKNINIDLKKLESFIHSSINTANSKGELIDKFWLEHKIKECFNKVEKKDAEILVNHIQYIIDNAKTRKVRGKIGLGISDRTVKGYKTFLGVINNYQKVIKRTIRLTEINSSFEDNFIKWLLDTEKQSMSYAGKHIDKLKSVCNDALRLGIPVHPYASHLQSFKEPNKDRNIVTLSFEEQKIIADTDMPTESLENIKKWILIGCTFGQRGEDLLNYTIQNSRKVDDLMCIDVWQRKVEKWVTVPIMYEKISDIILNEKPYKVSLQKLNKNIKTVCKIAGIDKLTKGGVMKVIEGKDTLTKNVVKKVEEGIDTLTKGEGKKVDDNKIKRKVKGDYLKWELITTHAFRRSFATNYDDFIPRPVLMGITGHIKESDYLYYINKQADKGDNARLFAMHWKQMMQAKKENNQNDQQDN